MQRIIGRIPKPVIALFAVAGLMLGVLLIVGLASHDAHAQTIEVAHDCDLGHYVPDTPARAAVDLNADGDTEDEGEAAVAAANGECFSQTTVTDRMQEIFIYVAIGLGVLVFIKGWRFIIMAIVAGINKAFATIGGLFRSA